MEYGTDDQQKYDNIEGNERVRPSKIQPIVVKPEFTVCQIFVRSLVGFLQSIICCVFTSLIIGCSWTIMIVFLTPRHIYVFEKAIMETRAIGPQFKFSLIILILIPISLWPFLVIFTSFVGGLYLGLIEPFYSTFLEEEVNENIFTAGIRKVFQHSVDFVITFWTHQTDELDKYLEKAKILEPKGTDQQPPDFNPLSIFVLLAYSLALQITGFVIMTGIKILPSLIQMWIILIRKYRQLLKSKLEAVLFFIPLLIGMFVIVPIVLLFFVICTLLVPFVQSPTAIYQVYARNFNAAQKKPFFDIWSFDLLSNGYIYDAQFSCIPEQLVIYDLDQFNNFMSNVSPLFFHQDEQENHFLLAPIVNMANSIIKPSQVMANQKLGLRPPLVDQSGNYEHHVKRDSAKKQDHQKEIPITSIQKSEVFESQEPEIRQPQFLKREIIPSQFPASREFNPCCFPCRLGIQSEQKHQPIIQISENGDQENQGHHHQHYNLASKVTPDMGSKTMQQEVGRMYQERQQNFLKLKSQDDGITPPKKKINLDIQYSQQQYPSFDSKEVKQQKLKKNGSEQSITEPDEQRIMQPHGDHSFEDSEKKSEIHSPQMQKALRNEQNSTEDQFFPDSSSQIRIEQFEPENRISQQFSTIESVDIESGVRQSNHHNEEKKSQKFQKKPKDMDIGKIWLSFRNFFHGINDDADNQEEVREKNSETEMKHITDEDHANPYTEQFIYDLSIKPYISAPQTFNYNNGDNHIRKINTDERFAIRPVIILEQKNDEEYDHDAQDKVVQNEPQRRGEKQDDNEIKSEILLQQLSKPMGQREDEGVEQKEQEI